MAVRATNHGTGNPIVVGDDVTAIISVGDAWAALATGEAAVLEAAEDYYLGQWEDAAEFSVRTPALSRVRETLREKFWVGVEADFTAMLDAVEAVRGGRDGISEVTISLLVAARHGELLYDIGR